MGRQTKLTAAQHEEIRAAVKEREFLRKRMKQDRHRLHRLTTRQLSLRYSVTPTTIRLVLSGYVYGSIKPEPCSSGS